MRLTNAPSNQLAFLVAALQPQNLDLSGSGLPGCFLLVAGNGQPGFLGTATAVTSASGAASFNIKLPEWLGQIDFYFQWFHLAPGPTFESTQRLLVRIVP